PRVTGPFWVPAHQKIPFNTFGGIGVGFETMCGGFSLQQKRKLESKHARLAGSVVSAKKQAAVFVMKFFSVILIDVQKPAANRLPSDSWRGGKTPRGPPFSKNRRSIHGSRCLLKSALRAHSAQSPEGELRPLPHFARVSARPADRAFFQRCR